MLNVKTPLNLIESMMLLRRFVPYSQMQCIEEGLTGEEAGYFQDKIFEYAERISNMPSTYETDGQGNDAIAHLHYFTANCDWYITEKDSEPDKAGQIQAFGLAKIFEPELGYISILELIRNGAELDLHFTPLPIRQFLK